MYDDVIHYAYVTKHEHRRNEMKRLPYEEKRARGIAELIWVKKMSFDAAFAFLIKQVERLYLSSEESEALRDALSLCFTDGVIKEHFKGHRFLMALSTKRKYELEKKALPA